MSDSMTKIWLHLKQLVVRANFGESVIVSNTISWDRKWASDTHFVSAS